MSCELWVYKVTLISDFLIWGAPREEWESRKKSINQNGFFLYNRKGETLAHINKSKNEIISCACCVWIVQVYVSCRRQIGSDLCHTQMAFIYRFPWHGTIKWAITHENQWYKYNNAKQKTENKRKKYITTLKWTINKGIYKHLGCVWLAWLGDWVEFAFFVIESTSYYMSRPLLHAEISLCGFML